MSSFGKNDTGNITGKVFEAEKTPAIYANIILKSVVDSTMIKGGITNDEGVFQLNEIPYGEYFITASYIGFDSFDTERFNLNTKKYELNNILLVSASSELSEVTVTALKPILEMRADKVVFNVEGTINASGENALDLMRKSPGVVVDNNDNINLLGKSGVKVFIDGKQNYLSGDELVSFLKTLQSDQIEAIEIITNPSAKYDAEGNAGIINIKIIKDKRFGSNAFINLGTRIGKKKSYNASVNGNYRNKWVNVFGRYGGGDYKGYNINNFHRSQYGQTYDVENYSNFGYIESNYKFGADFFLTEKSTLGFIVNGYKNESSNDSDGTTEIQQIEQSILDSVLISGNKGSGKMSNDTFNLNYKWDVDKESYFNVDLDYGKYSNANKDSLPNSYYNDFSKEQVFSQRNYQIDTQTDIDILTGKIDYERPFLSGKLGVGTKYASIKTDNTFEFYRYLNDDAILDVNQSNLFNYTENVFAFYTNYNGSYKKLSYQAGLRLEKTNSRGELETFNNQEEPVTKRSYLDFFPSVSFSYPVNEKNHLQLSYTRRINRPEYQDLNPFLSQLDELTYEIGNEKLGPEYTNNIQLRYSYNNFLNTTLSYSRTNDGISRVVQISGDNRGMLITKRNLGYQDHFSANIAAPITINKYWSTYTSLTGFYVHNVGDFGNEGSIDFSITSFNIYNQQSFKLPADFSFELSAWYSSPSVWAGNFRVNAMWAADAGIQKRFLDDRAKLKISFSDIFRTTRWSGGSEFGGMTMVGNGAHDSRRVKVNFSYTFGNTNVKSRKRNTGIEDENNRIKSGN